MAPQQVEKIEFAPGNGRASGAANPLDVVKGARLTVRDSARMTKSQKVAEKGAQGFEIARCKTEIGACRRRKRRASSLAGDRPEGLEPGESPSFLEPTRREAAECGPGAAGRGPEGGGRDKRFGESILTVWEACNPLKSHKTAKDLFGKAWTKTA